VIKKYIILPKTGEQDEKHTILFTNNEKSSNFALFN